MYGNKDTYNQDNYWMVQPTGRVLDEYVRYNAKISLRHIATSEMLHSHRQTSPISGQQEGTASCCYARITCDWRCTIDKLCFDIPNSIVCCFDQYDSNNYWTPLSTSNPESDDFWKIDDIVNIKHIETNGKLHSHACFLDEDRQEVTCFYENDDNDKVGHIRVVSLQVIRCLIELFNQSYSGK